MPSVDRGNIKETLFNLQIKDYILFNLRTVSNMIN